MGGRCTTCDSPVHVGWLVLESCMGDIHDYIIWYAREMSNSTNIGGGGGGGVIINLV